MSLVKKRYIFLAIILAMTSLLVFGCKKKENKPVIIDVEEVVFNFDEGLVRLPMLVGQEIDLTELITILPDNATDKSYIVESMDETVLSLKENKVTALKVGSTNLKVKPIENDLAAILVGVDVYNEVQNLKVPEDLQYLEEENKLSFKTENNAVGYTLNLSCTIDGHLETKDYNLTEGKLDLTDKIQKGVIYSAKVKSIAPTTRTQVFADSEFSLEYKFCVFGSVQELNFDNTTNSIKFKDQYKNTYSEYSIVVTEGSENIASHYIVANGEESFTYDVNFLTTENIDGNLFRINVSTNVSDDAKSKNQDVNFFGSKKEEKIVYVLDAPTNIKFLEQTSIVNGKLKLESTVSWADVRRPSGIGDIYYKVINNGNTLNEVTTKTSLVVDEILTEENVIQVGIDVSKMQDTMCRNIKSSITIKQSNSPEIILSDSSVEWTGKTVSGESVGGDFCYIITDKNGAVYDLKEKSNIKEYNFNNSSSKTHLAGEYTIDVYQLAYSSNNVYYRTSNVTTKTFEKRGITTADVSIIDRVFSILNPEGSYYLTLKRGSTVVENRTLSQENGGYSINFANESNITPGEYSISIKPYGDRINSIDGETAVVKEFIQYESADVLIANNQISLENKNINSTGEVEFKVYQIENENGVAITNDGPVYTQKTTKEKATFSVNLNDSSVKLHAGKYYITARVVGDDSSAFSTAETNSVLAKNFVVLNSPKLAGKDLGNSASVVISDASTSVLANNFILCDENKNIIKSDFIKLGSESVEYEFSLESGQERTFTAQAIGNGGNITSTSIITFNSPFRFNAEELEDVVISSITIKRIPTPQASYDRESNTVNLTWNVDESVNNITLNNTHESEGLRFENDLFDAKQKEFEMNKCGGLEVGNNNISIQYTAIGYGDTGYDETTNTNNSKFFINSFVSTICIHKIDSEQINFELNKNNQLSITNFEEEVDLYFNFSFDGETYLASVQGEGATQVFDFNKLTNGYIINLADSETFNAELPGLLDDFTVRASVIKTTSEIDDGVVTYFADSEYKTSDVFQFKKLIKATVVETNTDNKLIITSTNVEKNYIDIYINETLFKDNGQNSIVECNADGTIKEDGVELTYGYNGNKYTIDGIYENLTNLNIQDGDSINIKVNLKKTTSDSNMDSEYNVNAFIITYLKMAEISRSGQDIIFITSQTDHYNDDYEIIINGNANKIISGGNIEEVETTETYKSYKIAASEIFEKAEVNSTDTIVKIQLKALNKKYKTSIYSISEEFYIQQAINTSDYVWTFYEDDNNTTITFDRKLTDYEKTYIIEMWKDRINTPIAQYNENENSETDFKIDLRTFVYDDDSNVETDSIYLDSGDYWFETKILADSRYMNTECNAYVEVFNSPSLSRKEFSKLRTPYLVENDLVENNDRILIGNSAQSDEFEILCATDEAGEDFNILEAGTDYDINGNIFTLLNVQDNINYTLKVRVKKPGDVIDSDFGTILKVKRFENPTLEVSDSNPIITLPNGVAELYENYNITLELKANGTTYSTVLSDNGKSTFLNNGFKWFNNSDNEITFETTMVNQIFGTTQEKTSKDITLRLLFNSNTDTIVANMYLNTKQHEDVEPFTIERLAAPSNVTMDKNKTTPKIVWDAVYAQVGELVDGYDVYISYNGSSDKFATGNGTNLDFEKTNAGTYGITIYAKHKDYLTSVASTLFSYTILQGAQVEVNGKGNIQWGRIDGADSYQLVATTKTGEESIKKIKFDKDITEFDFIHAEYLDSGLYEITIQALVQGDDVTKQSGALSDKINVYRLPDVASISIDDGKLKIVGTPLAKTLRISYIQNDGEKSVVTVNYENEDFYSLSPLEIVGYVYDNNNSKEFILDLVDLGFDISGTGVFSVQMIGGVYYEVDGYGTYGLINSKIETAKVGGSQTNFNITPSNQNYNLEDKKVVENGTITFTNNAVSSAEMNYNFNNIGSLNEFWKDTLVYEITVKQYAFDELTYKIDNEISKEAKFYAVDYYKFIAAKDVLVTQNADQQTYYREVSTADFEDGTDKTLGNLVYVVIYKNADDTVIYFNVYEYNKIDFQNKDYLCYYNATYTAVDSFVSESEQYLSYFEIRDGGRYDVSIKTLAGDGLYLNSYVVNYKPIIRYNVNSLVGYNGNIEIYDMSQYIENQLVDSPIYMLKFVQSNNKIIVFLYDSTNGVTEDTIKENYTNDFIKQNADLEVVSEIIINSTQILESNIYYVPLESLTDKNGDHLLFDMSNCPAFTNGGKYDVYVQTLVGHPAVSDDSNYVLNARKPVGASISVNMLTKSTYFSIDNGVILVYGSYVNNESNYKEYAENYEIIIESTDGSNIYKGEQSFTGKFVVGSKCLYTNSGQDELICININEIAKENGISLVGNKEYKINIRGIATSSEVINGQFLEEGISFTTTNVVSGVSVENGTLTVSNSGDRYFIRVSNGASIIYIDNLTETSYHFNDDGYLEFGSNLSLNLTSGNTYKITVGMHATELNYVDSLYVDELVCCRLPSVDRQLIKAKNGVLQWNAIQYAKSYLVIVKSDENEFTYTVNATDEQLASGQVLLDLVTTCPDGQSQPINSGNYSISIRAIGTSEMVNNGELECYYLNSIITHSKIEFIKLAEVGNITVNADNITWDKVDGAEAYSIKFFAVDASGQETKIGVGEEYITKVNKLTIPENDQIYEELSNKLAYCKVEIKSIGRLITNILNSNPTTETSENPTCSNVSEEGLKFDDINNRYVWKMNDDFNGEDVVHFTYDFIEYTADGTNETKQQIISYSFADVSVAENGYTEKITYNSTANEFYIDLSVVAQYNNVYIYVARNGAVNSYKAKIENVNFKLYKYGQGTENSPYAISNEREFRNIKYFSDKNFEVVNNFVFVNNFEFGATETLELLSGINVFGDEEKTISGPILGKFEGIIDGKNNVIVFKAELTNAAKFALIDNVKNATIKNLQIVAQISNSVTTDKLQTNLSVLAVYLTNSTVENVHVVNSSTNVKNVNVIIYSELVISGTGSLDQSSISGLVVNASTSEMNGCGVSLRTVEIIQNQATSFGGIVANATDLTLTGKTSAGSTNDVNLTNINISYINEFGVAVASNINVFGVAVANLEIKDKGSSISGLSVNVIWKGISALTFGGIVGKSTGGTISNCKLLGEITKNGIKAGDSFTFGGVVGTSSNTTIDKNAIDNYSSIEAEIFFSGTFNSQVIGKYVGRLSSSADLTLKGGESKSQTNFGNAVKDGNNSIMGNKFTYSNEEYNNLGAYGKIG